MKKKIKWICIVLVVIFGFSVCIIANQITSGKELQDEQYIKMKEIECSNNLIGLSNGQVIELLGKPVEIYTYSDAKVYMYNAGHIYEGLIFRHRNFWMIKHNYAFYIDFDEKDKVKSFKIQELP